MSDPLRVGIVATSRYSVDEPHPGGMEAHTALLARGLRARGHHVTVFAGRTSRPGSGVEALTIRPARFSEAGRRDVSSAPDAFLDDHHAYLDLMTRLPQYGLDVLHNNCVHYLPPAMAPVAPPMVMTLHSPPTSWLESALGLGEGLRSRPHLVSVSLTNARMWPVAVDAVVANGVELDRWQPGAGRAGHAVWSGRIVPEKAPHLAIDAARRAGVELVLAGPVHDDEYFDDEVRPRLGPGVRHAGHLSITELSHLVGEASVALVTPVWDEPFGLVVAEALACGTPVAGFAAGALPELLDDRTGVLVPTGDVEALSRAIERAAGLDRAGCRRRAEKEFCAGVMVGRYLEQYRTVVRKERELAVS